MVLKIAIIGLGVMGRNHRRVLASMPGVQICGVCDPSFQESYSEPMFADYREMLTKAAPDAAVVAVPTQLHRAIAGVCIEHGIDLLIEKPVAATVADGSEIAEQASRRGVKVAVGHIERFNPVVSAVRRELAGKDIYSIAFTRVGHNPPRIKNIGILADLAVHDIDLLRFVTGRKILDTCVFKSSKIRYTHEDNAILSFLLEGDLVASVTTNWLTPFKRRHIEIATPEAYYEADLVAQELVEYSSYREDDTFLTRSCRVRKGEPLRNELEAFVQYLQTGVRGDLAAIEDSLETLRIVGKSGA